MGKSKQKNKKNIATELTRFPCPKCGIYVEPYLVTKKGIAMCDCSTHGLFQTSNAVSKNFRIFCSKVGSKPNRSPVYYTSSEQRVRRFLLRRGLLEGLDFFHNGRIGPFINQNKNKVYYWCDFVIPSKRLILECSPSVWHRMWNRESSDKRKSDLLKKLNWKPISLDEKDLHQLNKKRKKSKYPKTERVLEVYAIFKCQKEYVRPN